MSTRDDNPFARWSRRKLDVRSDDAGGPDVEEPARAEPKADVHAPAPQPGATEPVQTEPDEKAVEPLPRLEDLTADGDLSAFLRKGIPEALKRAAMRRMWSLDPGIRDYVGPAEYAWDFNQPGSMRGFGPLDPKDAVVNFLSKVGRAAIAVEREGTFADESELSRSVDVSTEREGNAQSDPIADTDRPPDAVAAAEPQPAPAPDVAATERRKDTADATQQPAARPRHGGALPR